MNPKNDSEKYEKNEVEAGSQMNSDPVQEPLLQDADGEEEEMVDLFEVARNPEIIGAEDVLPDASSETAAEAQAEEEETVDLYEIAAAAEAEAAAEAFSDIPSDTGDEMFVITDEADFSEDDDEDYDYAEDEEEYDDYAEDDEDDQDFSEEDDGEEYDEYADDDEDYDYADDEEEYDDYSEDDEDEEYSEDDDEDDEEYSEDDGEDDEEYSEDDGEDDEEYSDDDEDDEEYSDDDEDDEEYSDDDEDEYAYGAVDAISQRPEFTDSEWFEESDGEMFGDDGFVISVVGNAADETESVDLFEMANKADDLPVTENHGAIYYWAKRKTAGGWAKFAVKCVAAVLLLAVISGVLYFNGLLNLIDYKAAGDFEQFYNLSDTDYQLDVDDTYSSPVFYNESTTLEGFNESMIDIPKKDVLNILLIGTDVRGGTYEDRGNTDSMILVSVNTRDKNIKLTSFMRDMYVDIPDREWQRLNAAYAYGGPQLLFDTLKRNFDVDVDLYVRVNFANFRKIINHVGGVNIELTEAEARYMNKYAQKYDTALVEPGMQRLDGAQALSYARCRKIDSDFNRTKRQRTVIIALIDEIKKSSPGELNSLLNVFLPMIQTNMSKMQILSLMADGTRYLNSDVETLNIPIKNSWRSETIRRMSVICPNFELNKTAIVAHIYSTYRLDADGTQYQSFQTPSGDGTSSTARKTNATTAKTTKKASSDRTTETTSEQTAPSESKAAPESDPVTQKETTVSTTAKTQPATETTQSPKNSEPSSQAVG